MLDGEPEHATRGSAWLPKAPLGAALLHSFLSNPAKDAAYAALAEGAGL
jgi:hypothetical protein